MTHDEMKAMSEKGQSHQDQTETATARHSRYKWTIEKDHVADLEQPEGTNGNATGRCGPRNCPDIVPAGWRAEHFRMEDDDGELYYSGTLFFHPDCEDQSPDVWFFPLEDFGEPNAGCTSISYYDGVSRTWRVV